MAFGIPKMGDITAQLNSKFDELKAILNEVLQVLREIRDQRSPT
jgi:hypothetical protein